MVDKFAKIAFGRKKRPAGAKSGAGVEAKRGLQKKNIKRPSPKPPGPIAENWPKILAFTVCVLVFAAGFTLAHDWVVQTRQLPIARVKVDGAFHLTPRQVIRQAGIALGDNIFSLNLRLARLRLLANPWIADAKVRRELPDQIRIFINEHRPLAVFDLDDKYLLSAKGVLFKRAALPDISRFPLVQGLNISDVPDPGGPKSSGFAAALAVLSLGEKENAVLPFFRINRIFVDSEMGVTVFAFSPETGVVLGFNDYPVKYRRLARVFDLLKQKNPARQAAKIDVSDPQRVVVTWSPPRQADQPKEG